MVEVFKTDVEGVDESKTIIQKLIEHLPGNKINFDLDDCDNILRVEHPSISTEKIISLLNSYGYRCEVLV